MANLLESVEKAVVKLRRKRVSKSLFAKYGGEIQRGCFAGLKLDGRANISKGPLALKIFGLYESVVLDAIESHGPFGDLINVGAADGYFSLGLLKAGLAQRSICFEMTEEGRNAIARNAARNGLTDQVIILGEATERIGEEIAEYQFQPEKSLMICDIEGAEFKVLSKTFLNSLIGATMIIELHDRIQSDCAGLRQQLIDQLPSGYKHEILTWQPVSYSGIKDLDELSDNDRALATSEGRKAIGEWLFARPA